MKIGRSPHEMGPSLYHAPAADRGSFGARAGRLLAKEVSLLDEDLPPEVIPDSDRVSEDVEAFMSQLYGNDRYTEHNDRILKCYGRYAVREGTSEDDRAAIEIDRMAIILHDFVDHAILNPEKTAPKLDEPERGDEIKKEAWDTFNRVLNKVGDQDGLIKALLFAIDASKWEAAARIWRKGATQRIEESVAGGKIHAYTAKVDYAAVNKTPLLDSIGNEELARVLKTPGNINIFLDLKLEAISEGTLDHNIQGLFLKALETLDIIEHPPKDNPASTWRDCIEAINFFVPALATLGYKELAMDLRGAALKWLYDDPNGDAERQHRVSDRYFDDVKGIVTGLRKQRFGDLEINVEQRVKREGSLRAKLASKDYEELHEVPDGIGFSFIVPDEMSGSEMEQFAQSYMDSLTDGTYRIIAKHPNDNEEAFERKKQESGYEAVHMAFYYYPEDGSGAGVPFEIQVLTKTQNRMKLYGRSSDLFYKSGTSYDPVDQPHLDHLAKRGQAEREMAPGSTIHSISEALSLWPDSPDIDIPFVFNKLFRSVDLADGQRILVPHELEELASSLSAELAETFDGGEGLTVLPATKVNEAQFMEALRMFDVELPGDKNILDALTLVRHSEAGKLRADKLAFTLEGHILPTALSALILTMQSGKIWESEKLGPKEFMSNIVSIAILHDYVEAALEKYKDADVGTITQKRHDILLGIKLTFGVEIMEGVDALTSPLEITDQHERREQYSRNTQANAYARLIKPADRWQNHITDLVKLATGQADSAVYEEAMTYFAKTDRYQSDAFTSEDLSHVYARAHEVVWQFARHFGYRPKTTKN